MGERLQTRVGIEGYILRTRRLDLQLAVARARVAVVLGAVVAGVGAIGLHLGVVAHAPLVARPVGAVRNVALRHRDSVALVVNGEKLAGACARVLAKDVVDRLNLALGLAVALRRDDRLGILDVARLAGRQHGLACTDCRSIADDGAVDFPAVRCALDLDDAAPRALRFEGVVLAHVQVDADVGLKDVLRNAARGALLTLRRVPLEDGARAAMNALAVHRRVPMAVLAAAERPHVRVVAVVLNLPDVPVLAGRRAHRWVRAARDAADLVDLTCLAGVRGAPPDAGVNVLAAPRRGLPVAAAVRRAADVAVSRARVPLYLPVVAVRAVLRAQNVSPGVVRPLLADDLGLLQKMNSSGEGRGGGSM